MSGVFKTVCLRLCEKQWDSSAVQYTNSGSQEDVCSPLEHSTALSIVLPQQTQAGSQASCTHCYFHSLMDDTLWGALSLSLPLSPSPSLSLSL